jgi:ankyrin repeat protein
MGHSSIVSMLVEFGAPTSPLNREEDTPLHIASFMGHHSVVSVLIESGASTSPVNVDGDTPLHFSTRMGHGMIASTLINYGASTLQANKNEASPFQSVSTHPWPWISNPISHMARWISTPGGGH